MKSLLDVLMKLQGGRLPIYYLWPYTLLNMLEERKDAISDDVCPFYGDQR